MRGDILKEMYERLYASFGPQNWWPADSPFEVAVGAILTQNTNWSNVEKAIQHLKKAEVLSAIKLHQIPHSTLALLIRPAGYFNIKASRLKNFVDLLHSDYDGNMSDMALEPMQPMRRKLLAVNGIGPETADSILLYALEKPVFVIDSYTKRILSRHAIIDFYETYERFQRLFHARLDHDVSLFNEYHALIVRLAKDFCRSKPLCGGCPLERI